ncbi:MAG TPA: glycoside hydrolase family 36 protein [Candidatus Dormibacteraeota bacterium]|nr:glycoside hydrolase family 36 protein [Candidatus Dormibacteraeota bacterium]
MPAQIELEEGGLALHWAGAGALKKISALCTLAGGARHESAGWTPSGTGHAATCGPLEVRLEARADGELVTLTVTARATAEAAVTGVGIVAVPTLDEVAPGWWILNGYQSWDPADVVQIGGNNPPTSWWTAALAARDGSGIAVATATAERLAARFDFEDGRLQVLEGAPKGAPEMAWHARPGDEVKLEDLRLAGSQSAWEALREVAWMEPTQVPVPMGWLSWYHYGPWVSEEDVVENSQVLGDGAMHGLGYRVVQVDDGWQQAYGDWKVNTKFPNGLGEVAAILGASGQVTGIWTAPFLVSASADLATDAPEAWFLQDPTTGERLIDPVHISFGPMHVLDARNPEVTSHLEKVFGDLYGAGIRYFKIDFLYAGAYGGVEALRAGVQAVRRAVGDSYILACGAPLQPVAGLVEGCRIGQDTATPIYDFESGRPLARIFGDEVLWIARNVACRGHLEGWFQLDPDVALVGANLTIDQARQLVTAVAMSGGPFFASDALLELEPARLAMLTNPEVLALVGGRPAVPDWEPDSDRLAAIWRRGDEVLAAFNWNGPARKLLVEVEGAPRVRDLWQQADLQLSQGPLELDLKEGGTRLLKFEGGGRLRAWLE